MDRMDVEKVLIDIGMKPNLLGFEYMADAVTIMIESKEKKKICNIYKEIGEKRGKTTSSVERAIRSAIATARKQTKNTKLTQKYLGDRESSNSQSIMQMVKTMNMVDYARKKETETFENMIRRIVREELERNKRRSRRMK